MLGPTRNPFQSATHLSEPDNPEAWACGNSSFFAVQGGTPSPELAGLDKASRQQLLVRLVLNRASEPFDEVAVSRIQLQPRPSFKIERTPEQLVVRVALPLLERASEVVDVQACAARLELSFAHSYGRLEIDLPSRVSEEQLSAQFDVATKVLSLTLHAPK